MLSHFYPRSWPVWTALHSWVPRRHLWLCLYECPLWPIPGPDHCSLIRAWRFCEAYKPSTGLYTVMKSAVCTSLHIRKLNSRLARLVWSACGTRTYLRIKAVGSIGSFQPPPTSDDSTESEHGPQPPPSQQGQTLSNGGKSATYWPVLAHFPWWSPICDTTAITTTVSCVLTLHVTVMLPSGNLT